MIAYGRTPRPRAIIQKRHDNATRHLNLTLESAQRQALADAQASFDRNRACLFDCGTAVDRPGRFIRRIFAIRGGLTRCILIN